jgi:hypothetical protein
MENLVLWRMEAILNKFCAINFGLKEQVSASGENKRKLLYLDCEIIQNTV